MPSKADGGSLVFLKIRGVKRGEQGSRVSTSCVSQCRKRVQADEQNFALREARKEDKREKEEGRKEERKKKRNMCTCSGCFASSAPKADRGG